MVDHQEGALGGDDQTRGIILRKKKSRLLKLNGVVEPSLVTALILLVVFLGGCWFGLLRLSVLASNKVWCKHSLSRKAVF